MPKIESYEPGVPCWVELSTPDTPAAKEFYGELLGWTFEDNQATAEETYTLVSRKSDPDNFVCGMMRLTPEMADNGVPPNWATYISTTDVKQSASEIKAAGGGVMMEPMEVIPVSGELVGHMAIVSDTAGGVFGLWQAGEHYGANVMGEPGTVGWNEIGTTSKMDDLAPFYSSVFGWEREKHEMVGMPTPDGNPAFYNEFKVNGKPVAGGVEIPSNPGTGPGMGTFWSVYFQVENCDEAMQKGQELRAKHMMGPMDIPNGRIGALIDPQGAIFCLMHTN